MSEAEFKERVLAELADMKLDIREVKGDVKDLYPRVAVMETKALFGGAVAALVVTPIAVAILLEVLKR